MDARTPPRHDVVIARRLVMPARDGTRLVADVYRPAVGPDPLPGPFPAILVRTPYDDREGGPEVTNAEFFAERGYVYVIQDVRGRGDSEGEFVLLGDREGEDGYDAVEWVASLPFCDGAVGTQGTSLRGWSQSATALERPPHLRCMWINHGGFDGRRNALRHNGALELRWLAWAVVNAIDDPRIAGDPELVARQVHQAQRIPEWLRDLPWREGESPLAALPGYERWASELYRGADDEQLWRNRSRDLAAHVDESADVPTMHAGSWYDAYALATVERFAAHAARLRDQHLLMGPGVHGGESFDRRTAGDVDFGPGAPIADNLAADRRELMLRWFDHWLRGVDRGLGHGPCVHLFLTGSGDGHRTADGRLFDGGAWRAERAWPPDGTRPVTHHLGDGTLQPEPGADGARSFVFDPRDPLPTVAGNVSSLEQLLPLPSRTQGALAPTTLRRSLVVQGGADQVARADLGHPPPHGRPLAERSDVLSFRTPPLTDDLEVTGTPEAVLYLSSDAPDTDLFVLLIDVHPADDDWTEGFRLNVCDGLVRVRYREGVATPRLMDGSVVEVRIPLSPVCRRFRRGHRVQLLVSSSSFPRFDVNPNTGEPVGRHTTTRCATNTVHHGRRHPSRLVLPVAAAG